MGKEERLCVILVHGNSARSPCAPFQITDQSCYEFMNTQRFNKSCEIGLPGCSEKLAR